jgi:hypothetical protein
MSAEAPASGQLEIPRGAEANVGRAEPRRLGSATSLHWSNARRGQVVINLVARLISTVITKHEELETRLAGGSNTTSTERCRFGRSCRWRSSWGCTGSCSRSRHEISILKLMHRTIRSSDAQDSARPLCASLCPWPRTYLVSSC